MARTVVRSGYPFLSSVKMGQDQMEKSESVVPTTAILCGKNTRNYCGFNKAVTYCSRCYAAHLLSVIR